MVVVAVMPGCWFNDQYREIDPIDQPEHGDTLSLRVAFLKVLVGQLLGTCILLFALAIGGSWAKDRAGGAFAAGISFCFDQSDHRSDFRGHNRDVSQRRRLHTYVVRYTNHGERILYECLRSSCIEHGVFVGIIAGFVGAMAYNKYYNYRKLPDALSFFNGKRFVPFVVILWSTIVALILAAVWPAIQARNQQLWFMDCTIAR